MKRLRRWWRLYGPRRDDYAIGYGAKLPKSATLVGKKAIIPIKTSHGYSQVEALIEPQKTLNSRMGDVIRSVWSSKALMRQMYGGRPFLSMLDEPYRPGWNEAVRWLENRQAKVEAEARHKRELAVEWPFPKWVPVADRPAGYDPEYDWMED